MIKSSIIKVAFTLGKGLLIVAKGESARIVATAVAIGVVTVSIAVAVGIVLKSKRQLLEHPVPLKLKPKSLI